jgi:hypothetical protein
VDPDVLCFSHLRWDVRDARGGVRVAVPRLPGTMVDDPVT